MVRAFGLVLVLLAGCGTGAEPAAEAGSVEVWLERMRETKSVRFDISHKTEGRRPMWWTKQGSLSPVSHGIYPSDAPAPTSHMTHRYKSYVDDSTVEYQAIERESDILLSDPRAKMPAGKRWVKLDLRAAMSAYNRHRNITMAFDDVHPTGVFSDLDRDTLVISAGTREQLDGVAVVKYDLTAGAGVETNPNTAKGRRVSATVWVGAKGLPVKIEQRSTGDDGSPNIRTSKFTDWDSTPMVELPPPAELAAITEVTLPER